MFVYSPYKKAPTSFSTSLVSFTQILGVTYKTVRVVARLADDSGGNDTWSVSLTRRADSPESVSANCQALLTKAGFRFCVKHGDVEACLPEGVINVDRQRKQ